MRFKKAEIEFIGLTRVCRLATVDQAGAPSCVPVCPVLDGKRIYFGTEASARKVRNLKMNNHVALVYDDYSEAWSSLRGIMIKGKGRIVEKGPVFRKARRLLYGKYPQYEEQAALEEGESAIVEVTPLRIFSWGF